MSDAVYIDTSSPLFAPPAEVESYQEWLEANYQHARIKIGKHEQCYGIAQRINAALFAARRQKAKIIVIGAHAKDAARAIYKLSGSQVIPKLGIGRRQHEQ